MEQLQAFILPIGLLVIFYVFAVRPQKKKEKEIKEMRSALRKGDEVITIGGLYGKVSAVKQDTLVLEIGSTKNKIEVTKWAIGSIVTPESKRAPLEVETEAEPPQEM